ncbi:UDP-N-acetylglucosamine 2-epimerase [Endozoicomonas acroporae]|uniref:UDP-N-acetylglucosamine 2-epimerase n=1 Tax=Endozoicomonas acroporae TaxID=1701104 RepID=UPI000C78604F|nr:UDP-N-acetylglucosamine 2-epimerase [Endozoicomonas acroporae]
MRKIAIFTGTRAEYGLLYWVINGIHESSQAELQLLVGGMHLSPEFGYTIDRIEQDGFPIAERMEFLLSSDSPVGLTKSMGLALISASEALQRQKPDLLVILGDRFEALAIAQAAMVARVPVAHLHGGETTEGAIDEAFRHAITKMAHLHFTSTEAYRQRVIQLGENPENVFNYGAPGIDNIIRLPLLNREELSKAIGIEIDSRFFLVTYHPVTLTSDGAISSLSNLLAVLDRYPEHQLIITYPNADTHGRKLIELLEAYKRDNPERVQLVQSLGQLRYLSAMKFCDAVIGNSSSGLIETPTFGTPTLNIGDRQKGRIFGNTVINCGDSENEIESGMKKIMNPDFRQECKKSHNPYGKGDSSEKILETIINHPLENLIKKTFFDLEIKY